MFLEPDREVLVARSGEDVIRHLRTLGTTRAKMIGDAALQRVLAEHTYQHRAEQLQQLLDGRIEFERVEDAA